jgi:hypothetical protein
MGYHNVPHPGLGWSGGRGRGCIAMYVYIDWDEYLIFLVDEGLP